jgi:hypothetical protein
MLYKTIVLELLQQRTEFYEELRSARMLPSALETYSKELKTHHETWKETLSRARPGSDPSQIGSEALELALKELESRLPPVHPHEQDGVLSLDEAMAYLRNPSPRE